MFGRRSRRPKPPVGALALPLGIGEVSRDANMFVRWITGKRRVRSGMPTTSEAAPAESESAPESASASGTVAETTVTVRCTGHVRTELGECEFEYTFNGDTLHEFLDELFAEYPELRNFEEKAPP